MSYANVGGRLNLKMQINKQITCSKRLMFFLDYVVLLRLLRVYTHYILIYCID